MPDESARLTEQERRILAEIELDMQHHDSDLARSLTGRSWFLRASLSGRARPAWWAALLGGVGLLVCGLPIGSVAVAAAGFVTTVVVVTALTSRIDTMCVLARVRRWVGATRPPRSDSGHL